MPETPLSILLIHDDLEPCALLSEILENEGFAVASAHDGPSGLAAADEGAFYLAIVDVILPARRRRGWQRRMTNFAFKLLLLAIAFAGTVLCASTAPGSAEALRRHVEFLASQELQGRGNGSAGMNAAADYIAAQFKEAGLKPAGTDGYFQTAELTLLAPNLESYFLHFRDAGHDIAVAPDEILLLAAVGLDLNDIATVKIDPDDSTAVARLKPEDVAGKVALLKIITKKEGEKRWANMMRVLKQIQEMGPALIVNYGPNAAKADLPGIFLLPGESPARGVPQFPIRTKALREAMESLRPGLTPLRVTFHLGPPVRRAVKCRNVVAMLPGSVIGPDTRYVVLTANYDGFNLLRGEGVLPGANANASAIASLIETARMLGGSKPRPRRSILFVALFGEQAVGTGPLNGLGGKTYLKSPPVPLDRTDACIKLAQLGRTDASDGPKLRSLAVTRLAGSRVPELLAAAGKAVGIEVYEDYARDAIKEGRGFRPLLLDSGIASHTLFVAYDPADANTAGDTAKKLDYENMASVQRAIAAGLFTLADGKASLSPGKSPFLSVPEGGVSVTGKKK